MKFPFPYVNCYTDQNGKIRRYFRFPGQPKVALRGEPGSPEFMAVYGPALEAALAARIQDRFRHWGRPRRAGQENNQ